MNELFSKMKSTSSFASFIRSFALFLLALVLLVSAVLAWMVTGSDTTATGIAVKTEDISSVEFGNPYDTNVSLLLPSTTSMTLTQAQIEKAIVIKEYTVSSGTRTVYAKVTPSSGSSGLHYYISSVGTPSVCAAALKAGTDSDKEGSVNLTYDSTASKYSGSVFVAFYAEYYGALNNKSSAAYSLNRRTYNAKITLSSQPIG